MNLLSTLCLAAALLFGFGPAEAQQPTKLAKIGWLGVRGSGSGSEVFRREFRALGYIEGKNAAILYRYAENRMDRLPGFSRRTDSPKGGCHRDARDGCRIRGKKRDPNDPDRIFNVSDPIGSGLVDNLAQPRENVTGVTTIASVLAGKRLELIKETIPKLSRVAFL